jgi:hypothetical protein
MACRGPTRQTRPMQKLRGRCPRRGLPRCTPVREATSAKVALAGLMGTYVYPDKVIAARKAGASPWELHERPSAGSLLRFSRMTPRVLL